MACAVDMTHLNLVNFPLSLFIKIFIALQNSIFSQSYQSFYDLIIA